MNVTSGYALPFAFRYATGTFDGAGIAKLVVSLKDNSNTAPIELAVNRFTELGNAGALGDTSHTPWDSSVQTNTVLAVPGERRWQIDYRALCPQSLVVLAHLLLGAHQSAPLASAVITTAHGQQLQSLHADAAGRSTYPTACKTLRFAFDDLEPESGGLSVLAMTASPVLPPHEQWLNQALDSWARAIFEGGYALAPTNVARSFVERHEPRATVYDCTIEHAVFKITADIDAVSAALLNLYCRFDRCCVPIVRLEFA